MIAMTLAEVAAAVHGKIDCADPGLVVTANVVTDSRAVAPGDLFVAIRGETADGHDFAAEAAGRHAVATLADHPVGTAAVVAAKGTVAALGELAAALLDRLPNVVVVAVTGSSGKTSTKDLLAQVLAAAGPTVAAEGSFNNEIGLPMTILRADASTRVLVLEMGSRGPGHIADLCAIARPSVGIALNVGHAHVGEFGGIDETAAAKAELITALPPGGVAILNADDPRVAAMSAATQARVMTFGLAPAADVRAEGVELDQHARARFVLANDQQRIPLQLGLHGEHHVSNALAAAAAGITLGLDLPVIAARLAAARSLSPWRMDVITAADGLMVVNDSYNANPQSVAAALRALAAMAADRRAWAVLGEMRELGEHGDPQHAQAGRLAVRLGIDRVVSVGEPARAVSAAAGAGGGSGVRVWHVADVDDALALLGPALRAGDVVLVKASRAAGLERLAQALVEAHGGPAPAGPGAQEQQR